MSLLLRFTKRRFILLLIVLFIIIILYKHNDRPSSLVVKMTNHNTTGIFNKNYENKYNATNFLMKISKKRIDELFKILKKQEEKFKVLFRRLDILLFEDIVNKNEHESNVYFENKNDISKYFEINFGEVVVKEDFINELKYLSNYFSIFMPRNQVQPAIITVRSILRLQLTIKMIVFLLLFKADDGLVIVTAVNSNYYGSLQNAVFFIHEHFPNCKLIIYDLGLNPGQLIKTKEKCRCEVRHFNSNFEYSKIASHVLNLKTYAWKPLIIQVSL